MLKILSLSDDPEDDKEAAQSVRSIKSNKKSFFRFPRKERYVVWHLPLPPLDFMYFRSTFFFWKAVTCFPLRDAVQVRLMACFYVTQSPHGTIFYHKVGNMLHAAR